MMYVGFWFFEVFRGHVSSSHILSYGFVALALPATVVGLLEVFGRDGPDRDETLKHLLAGLGLVILGVLFVLGQLP